MWSWKYIGKSYIYPQILHIRIHIFSSVVLRICYTSQRNTCILPRLKQSKVTLSLLPKKKKKSNIISYCALQFPNERNGFFLLFIYERVNRMVLDVKCYIFTIGKWVAGPVNVYRSFGATQTRDTYCVWLAVLVS